MITKLENIIIKGIKYKSQYFLRIITIYFPTIILFPKSNTLFYEFREKLGVAPLSAKMRENRLRWFGHV